MEFARADIEQTLVDRFRSVAQSYPDRPALVDDATHLTYRQLDEASDRLASHIAAAGKTGNGRVALLLPSGADSVIAILAIGKAGAVYIPLDPRWPLERLQSVLLDINPSVIVFSSGREPVRNGLAANDAIWIDASRVEESVAFELPAQPSPAAPAAIYFSSGSTGTPKGIVLSHRCMLNSARNYIHHMEISADDRIAWTSPVAFGASTGPIFSALCSGAAIARFDVGEKGFPALAGWLDSESITVWMTSATLFRSFASTLPDGQGFPRLRLIKVGGETVYTSDAQLLFRRFHADCILLNGLGITEAGGNVCFYRHSRDAILADDRTIPVGYTVDGMEIFLLDESNNPVAPGDVGEIALCSDFLFDGYWQREILNRECFLSLPGKRYPVFLTGDLGRMDTQGRLVHASRKDHVVKIRGFRIDVSAVESVLTGLVGVRQAVVMSKKHGEADRLIAYVSWQAPHAMTVKALRHALSLKLPNYMVPSQFFVLSSMPMLPNGKVDREALRTMSAEPLRNAPSISHQNPLEYELIRIMEKSIGLSGMGIHDDFFEMGGDSLSAARMLALIGRHLDVLLPLTILTKAATPARLAEVIREWRNDIEQPSVILLEPGNEHAPPLFCVPGAGSDAFSLVHLARHVGVSHPFYGLQYSGLDGKSEFQNSLPQMAARFIRDIRRIQPQGPYYLGGSSFGGWVAFEIAQQLIREGERVAMLALLDSYGPGYPKLRSKRSCKQQLLIILRWLLPVGRKDTFTRKNLALGLREKWNILQVHLRKLFRRKNRSLPFILRFTTLQQNCFLARKRYKAEPYPGAIDLFRAMQQPSEFLFERMDDLGWGRLAGGGLLIHDIPGLHTAHIREPHVSVLASKLMRRMHETVCQKPDMLRSMGDRFRRAWDQVADWWDETSGDEGHEATRHVIVPEMRRMLGPVTGRSMLDVGCGNGWFARSLAREGAMVTAIDFSPRMIARATQRTGGENLSIEYLVLDVTKRHDWNQLSSRSFDAVYAYMVLMDVADIGVLMENVSLLLSPGGVFVAVMVHPDSAGLESAQPGEALTTINAESQPGPTFYFHRSIDQITSNAGNAGLVVDEMKSLAVNANSEKTNKILMVRWRKPEAS